MIRKTIWCPWVARLDYDTWLLGGVWTSLWMATCINWGNVQLWSVRMCFFSHSDEVQADDLLGSDKVAQQWSSALFLIKLKEFRRLSQVAIDDIIQEWNGLFSHTLQRLHAEVWRTLAENGIDVSSIAGLPEIFQSAPSPFLGLETCHMSAVQRLPAFWRFHY